MIAKLKINFCIKCLLSSAVCLLVIAVAAHAQTTEFTYQGRLNDNGTAANGTYDFQLKLFKTVASGTQVGATQIINGVSVVDGIFTVNVSFGYGGVILNGTDTFLEIAVKRPAETDFTVLAPRQKVTSAPYSIRSLQATSALSADDAANLGGIAANQFVQTNDARLSDARTPLSGSGNYVQNSTTQQAATSFNISGGGTLGGALSANQINSETQFNLRGGRILTQTGINNLFVGFDAGTNNTGSGNTFVGTSAGSQNAGGSFNTFNGVFSGSANTTGNSNTFVGMSAGASNTIGASNSFFGRNSGTANTEGVYNSFFGRESGAANTLGYENAFFGYETGKANTSGYQNSFFGKGAGLSNTTAINNSFFGSRAGNTNSNGSFNSFFGSDAGFSNSSGASNSFFGMNAGYTNSTGNFNSFFGHNAGQGNTSASGNSFFGANAGMLSDILAADNSFFGYDAGRNNSNGSANTFLGVQAGQSNTTGRQNVFVGYGAGRNNTNGTGNTVIGFNATTVSSSLIQYSTAIGTEAVVSQNNSLVLGGTGFYQVNVGINTTAPRAKLHIVGGKIYVESNGQGVILKSPAGSCFELTVNNAGALTTAAVTCP